MSKLLFLAILFSGVLAKAETYYLNDFLFHLKAKINNSRDLGQLVSQIPGTLEQKSAFAKQVRENKLANQTPPKAQVNGTKLEIDLKPKLVIDFAQLDKLILTVNGKKLDLRTNKDWMGQFNSAYRPGISWIDLVLQKSYAEGPATSAVKLEMAKLYALDSLDKNLAKPMGELANKAISKVKDAAGTVYAFSLGTYLRCKSGIDECSFFSDAGVIIEQLSEGELRGLTEFQCEDGKLKKIQALEAKDGSRKKIPSYQFTYTAGADDVKINVKDFGLNSDNKANCEFVFNSTTKEIRGTEANSDKCQIWERANLRTIAFDTPLDSAFRCCQKKDCEEKVTKFRSDYTSKALKAAGENLAVPAKAESVQ